MSAANKHQIKLHVIGVEGSIWSTEVKGSTKVEKLKNTAISYFYSLGLQSYTDGGAFRLVSVSQKKTLTDDMTVIQEEVKDNEEMLLVKGRPEHSRIAEREGNLRGPTAEEIAEATKHLEKRNCERQQPVSEGASDFQDEFRRILVSLIEAAARLLSPSPDGMKIFNLLNEKMKRQGEPSPDNPSVKQLTDMGFPQRKVLMALKMKKMNVSEATDWLLHQGSDSEEEEEQLEVGTSKPQNVVEAFQGLLQSLLSAKKRQFTPNSKYLQNLKEMGFEEKEVKEALRISGNNQSAACSWLLGDQKGKIPDEADERLDPDEPMYKALIRNPLIQINLTKPKVLFAFLTILENPSAADLWINDDEIAPVLNHIFKTYHTEKLSKPSSDALTGNSLHFGESPETSLSSQLTSLFGSNNDDDDVDDELDEDDDDEGNPLW